MARLLVAHHTPTPHLERLLAEILAGARDDLVSGTDVLARPAAQVTQDEAMRADAYVLLTPANFGYMSGALKSFFDSHFLALGGALSAGGAPASGAGGRKPWALVVHGRHDTTGAVRSVTAIAQALPWRQVAAPVELLGDVDAAGAAAARDAGATVAALAAESSPDTVWGIG